MLGFDRAIPLRKFISEIHEPRRGLWRKVATIKVERVGGGDDYEGCCADVVRLNFER